MNYVVHEQYEKLNKIEQLNKMNNTTISCIGKYTLNGA